ncbi:hypothetical protein EZV62_014989 [Acer yangbiense]|uniref:Uncharacterized protein n=1 Tax=Acer yangbiense TaxID=1000413 RepID=A0A5C7HVS9_9ROSI|nr:hypothetical protein EZV62_014989 [Acer yangbiense]
MVLGWTLSLKIGFGEKRILDDNNDESLVDAADNSPKGHTEDERSESSSVEETRISVAKNVKIQLTNVTTSHVPQWTESDGDKTFSTKKKVCNYAKGSWVADNQRPLYSGSGCQQWLSRMWACRLTQRTDFSYERYRWQPKDCEFPEFERSAFLRRHHWNRGKLRANRWVMYVNGKPIEDEGLVDLANAKNFTVYSVTRWLDSQLSSHPRLKVFFRTISPWHFLNGDWNSGGCCDNTTSLTGGSEVVQDKSSDEVIEGAVMSTRVKLLDITALPELRDEGHISRYSVKATQGVNDCLHWCLPGIPDTWNELLAAQV